VIDPLFWLGLSILLVAVSLTAVLIVALPALQELARAARSAEKLFDTLNRELPPTLESIRLTGMEISDLTDEVSEGVQSAGQVVKQVDQSLQGVKKQAQRAQVTTRSVFTGFKAAWKTLRQSPSRRSFDRLPSGSRPSLELDDDYAGRSSQRRTYREEYSEEWEETLTEQESEDRDYRPIDSAEAATANWEERSEKNSFTSQVRHLGDRAEP
jgi:uncharacterized protein YoxC